MGIKKQLLVFLFAVSMHAYAQDVQHPTLNIGDPAPTLHVHEWVKGSPVHKMEKGRIYVIEFWATWCRPCIAAMPHLTALAHQYEDKLTVIGIDLYENENTSVKDIRAFVDSLGNKMDYHVAIGDEVRMEDEWIEAADEKGNGIPRTFVVDTEGRLAWIGHPKDLDTVLQKMVDGDWQIDEALANRNEQRHLSRLDSEAGSLFRWYYSYDDLIPGSADKPDSILLLVEEMTSTEPKLKYGRLISIYTLSSLFETNRQGEAYEYGQEILASQGEVIRNRTYDSIISIVSEYSDNMVLLPEIYRLCAEAYQKRIDCVVYPELVDIPGNYNNMAKWYWRAGDKENAIAAQQKAIETLKSRIGFSVSDLAAFETTLQQYTEMGTVN